MIEQSQQSNTASPTAGRESSSLTAIAPELRQRLAEVNSKAAGSPKPNDAPQCVGEILRSLTLPSLIRLPSRSQSPDQRLRAAVRMANVPLRHETRQHVESAAPEKWRQTRDGLLTGMGTGYLFAMIGPRGTGKTQIAVDAMVSSCGHDRQALYCKAMELFLLLREAKNTEGGSELRVLSGFLSPRLLVIDEVGERGETDFEDRMLVYVIDKRYDAMLDTILIANMTEPAFRETMGPSISDRLREAGGVIVCDWESFRKQEPAQ